MKLILMINRNYRGANFMKKLLVAVLIGCLFMITACSHDQTKTLEQFYRDAKIEKIDKVIIQSGSTGVSKTMMDEKQIDEFMTSIKHAEFTPQKNQEERTGWSFRIILFDENRKFEFFPNQINDTYYDSNPDIYPIVANYYEQFIATEAN